MALTVWERLQQDDPLDAAPYKGWFSRRYYDRFGYAVWSAPGGLTRQVTHITPWDAPDSGTQWNDIVPVGPVIRLIVNYPSDEARLERQLAKEMRFTDPPFFREKAQVRKFLDEFSMKTTVPKFDFQE